MPISLRIGIKLTGDSEAGIGGGVGDQLGDGQMADEQLATPIHGDEGERTRLPLLPFAARQLSGDEPAEADVHSFS
jgi:hypothetical protein